MFLFQHCIRYLLIVLCGILLTCKGYAMEQKFIVTYKVLTQSQLENLYILPMQANGLESENNNSNLYAFGFIQIHPSYHVPRVMVELTFFNPSKKAFVKSTNLGWIGKTDKRFFLIYLGNKNQFSFIDYSTKVLMEK